MIGYGYKFLASKVEDHICILADSYCTNNGQIVVMYCNLVSSICMNTSFCEFPKLLFLGLLLY